MSFCYSTCLPVFEMFPTPSHFIQQSALLKKPLFKKKQVKTNSMIFRVENKQMNQDIPAVFIPKEGDWRW